MNNPTLKLLSAALLLGLSGASLAAGNIFLTMDPAKTEPTIVSNTNHQKKMHVRSINYVNPALKGDTFVLVFEPAFAGQFHVGANLTPGVQDPNTNEWRFASVPALNGPQCKYRPPGSGVFHKCEEVKIKLKNSPSATTPGFHYRVEMAGKTLDPRWRGK